MSNPENNPYNNPSPYGQNPYGQGNTPPPVPPASQGNTPYENSPYAQSPYQNSPYANGGVQQGYQSEEGKKKATLATVFGVISIFFFSFIFGPLAIYQGTKANALGGNGKPGIILGIVGMGLALISSIFYFATR